MPPFTVQFLCEYRPIWRDAVTTPRWAEAVQACYQLRKSRQRPARIIDDNGQEVYALL